MTIPSTMRDLRFEGFIFQTFRSPVYDENNTNGLFTAIFAALPAAYAKHTGLAGFFYFAWITPACRLHTIYYYSVNVFDN